MGKKRKGEGAVRKVLLCFLTVVLCISLLGCAMEDGYGKYAELYKLLDAGDFEGAHAAIDALAGIVPTTATEPPETGSPATTQPTVLTEPPATQPTDGTTEPVTYVLNTSSMRIHKPGCGSVETIKESNRQATSKSREELIAEGYEPCGRCNP
jgi:hypothetical protein